MRFSGEAKLLVTVAAEGLCASSNHARKAPSPPAAQTSPFHLLSQLHHSPLRCLSSTFSTCFNTQYTVHADGCVRLASAANDNTAGSRRKHKLWCNLSRFPYCTVVFSGTIVTLSSPSNRPPNQPHPVDWQLWFHNQTALWQTGQIRCEMAQSDSCTPSCHNSPGL